MRELSFKGYLEQQLCELSDYNGKSLYKFAKIAERNARLKDVLCLYLHFYVSEKLTSQLTKKFVYLSDCKSLTAQTSEQLAQTQSGYKTIYENYLNRKNSKQNNDKLKALMQKRIVELKKEKGITNYRIYKTLSLNSGNVNTFLKKGDVSKVSLDTARRILAYVNQ